MCLGLKHRGSWHLRRGEPVTNKPTPGCTTDRKRTGGGQGAAGEMEGGQTARISGLDKWVGHGDGVRHRDKDKVLDRRVKT